MNQKSLLKIWLIAKSTYKEIIRDRLLYGILIIALLVVASSFFLSTISMGQDTRVLQDIGLAAIQLFTLFICAFVATNSINHDFENRALYLLLSKPITRSQYILGKWVGTILLLLTTLLILGGLFTIGVYFVQHNLVVNSLINLGFAFLEISFLSAFAVLFASFTAPLNATLYTLAIFIIGHSLVTLKEYVVAMGMNTFVKDLVNVCYYLLPNLEKFDMRRSVLYGLHIPASTAAWSIVYWLIYTTFILFLAVQVMKNREV
jgi:ABC-type transport system involved in multi-copper enzyme maturation permease subunit